MPENLELKAKVDDLKYCESVARSIGAKLLETLHQEDTYFVANSGRLKLRIINSGIGELIYYDRDESEVYRTSRYQKFDTDNPQPLLRILTKSLPTKVIVEKDRAVWLYQNIRIHLDNVKDLGFFIEFEIPLSPQTDESSRWMDHLVREFSVDRSEIVLCSYSDMLLQHS